LILGNIIDVRLLESGESEREQVLFAFPPDYQARYGLQQATFWQQDGQRSNLISL
jgi:hypothetical protein